MNPMGLEPPGARESVPSGGNSQRRHMPFLPCFIKPCGTWKILFLFIIAQNRIHGKAGQDRFDFSVKIYYDMECE